MERTVVRKLAILAATVPAAIVGVQALGAVAGSLHSANPHWEESPVNLTEAAALRDAATVLRLMAGGADPHQRYELRRDLVFNEPATMTPFEGAIATGRTEVASLMLWTGYRVDAPEWRQLRCLAQLQNNDDIGALLDKVKPTGEPLNCDGVTRPWTR
jgi:hypothetical protein